MKYVGLQDLALNPLLTPQQESSFKDKIKSLASMSTGLRPFGADWWLFDFA
jgi:hypothetical protein